MRRLVDDLRRHHSHATSLDLDARRKVLQLLQRLFALGMQQMLCGVGPQIVTWLEAARQASRSVEARSFARGDAFHAPVRAGRNALARGASKEEAIEAAHEAGEALWQEEPPWRSTDRARIAESLVAGTWTHRHGTDEEKAALAEIAEAAVRWGGACLGGANPQAGG